MPGNGTARRVESAGCPDQLNRGARPSSDAALPCAAVALRDAQEPGVVLPGGSPADVALAGGSLAGVALPVGPLADVAEPVG